MDKLPKIWPIAPKKVECPSCKKSNQLYLHDAATHYACEHCKLFVDVAEQKTQKISSNKRGFDLVWPIGKTAQIRGISYQLTGAILRKEKGASYTWMEYCFFNPLHGFLYLSEYTGNWILLKETSIFPQVKINNHTIEDAEQNQYQLFLRYQTDCLNAIGEFPYNALDENVKLIKEYINPPVMYLLKEYHNETIWFKGDHISRKELKEALGDSEFAPPKIGKGSIEPQFLGIEYKAFAIYAALIILLMGVFTLYFEDNLESKKVFNQSYYFNCTDSANKVYVGEGFKLEKGINNLELFFHTKLEQNWVEAEITLINDDLDEEYTLTKELYYYTGYDDEGSWTDGTNESSEIFSNIPAGNYHIQVIPYLSPNPMNVSLDLEIYRGVAVRSNFYYFIGLLIILVYIQYLRYMSFERKRWSNSNYSTYDHRSWFERNLGGSDE